MPITLALVGCGGMGRRHVLGMAKLKGAGRLSFDLSAVCDVLPDNARAAADRAEEVLGRRPRAFTDFESLVLSRSVDAIIVTTTPETHAEIALRLRGRHRRHGRKAHRAVRGRWIAAGGWGAGRRAQTGGGRELPPRPDQPAGQGPGG